MADRQETHAQELRDTYEGQFGEYTIQQLEEEIIRQIKSKADHQESKKAYAKTYSDLIKDCNSAIEYVVGRIDYLQHEEAVAAQLEAARP
jgi:hemerythrin-like domain-containing protein